MGEAEDRIRKTVVDNATVDARQYFLTNQFIRYPTSGGWTVSPFEWPTVPTGSYRVGYLDAAGQSIEPRFAAAPPRLNIVGELPSTPSTAPKTTAPPTATKTTEALATSKRHAADLVEFSRERMADELLENRQLLSKKLRLAHDQAEQLVLGRAYRHELAAQSLVNTNQQQRNADVLERLQQLLLTMVEQQQVVEARRIETLAKTAAEAPPAPSPLASFLSMASEFAPLLAALFGQKAKSRTKGAIDAKIEEGEGLARLKSEVRALKKKVKAKQKEKEAKTLARPKDGGKKTANRSETEKAPKKEGKKAQKKQLTEKQS